MYRAIAFVQLDHVSERNHNQLVGLFFVGFVIVGSFFVLNLFVGIVISNFNRERERIGKDFLLTEGQKKWVETKLMVIRAEPKLLEKSPDNPVSRACFNLQSRPPFETGVYLSIILNTITLATAWRGASS